METGLDREKLLQYKALAVKHLSDPVKLRLLVVSGLVLLAIVASYVPLSDRIRHQRGMLRDRKHRVEVIREVGALREEVNSYRQRIGEGADTNEWVQYILGGLRQVRVKLRDMSSRPPQKVGPYQTVTLAIEVEGTYAEMKRLVEWLEQSKRLLRVDTIRLEKQPHSLVMRIVLLGLVQKHAGPA